MNNVPDRIYFQDGDMHCVSHEGGGKQIANKGGGKPRPYPVRFLLMLARLSYRVGAALAPALATILIAHKGWLFHKSGRELATRFLYLLLTALFIYTSCILFSMSSSQKALAQGNTFIVTMLGSSQQPGFAPDLLTVHVYDTVVFVNSAAVPIAIAATDTSFSSPAIAPGKQWKVTFNSVGAFEYHENSPTPHTFGEIVVVPNAVSLLPTPVPAARETAITYIQAGKAPPDTIWRQTASSVQTPADIASAPKTTRSLSVPPLALLLGFVRPVILVVIVLFALLAIGLGGYWLYRRRQFRQKEEDDEEEDDDDE